MALTHADTGAHPRQSRFRPRRSPATPLEPLKANIHPNDQNPNDQNPNDQNRFVGGDPDVAFGHRCYFQKSSTCADVNTRRRGSVRLGCTSSGRDGLGGNPVR